MDTEQVILLLLMQNILPRFIFVRTRTTIKEEHPRHQQNLIDLFISEENREANKEGGSKCFDVTKCFCAFFKSFTTTNADSFLRYRFARSNNPHELSEQSKVPRGAAPLAAFPWLSPKGSGEGHFLKAKSIHKHQSLFVQCSSGPSDRVHRCLNGN